MPSDLHQAGGVRPSLDEVFETVVFVAGSARATAAARQPAVRILTALILLGLLLLGILHWLMVFNFGHMAFRVEDWSKEFFYYSILQQSLQSGHLPLHVTPALQETSRFLAIPETVLSPQIVLLRWLDIGPFVVANTILMFTVGFCGCLLLRSRFQLSLGAFLMLYLLFNFNGHIVAHLTVGHSMWNGYFLLPFFALWVSDLVDPHRPIPAGVDRTALKLALVLLGIVLQGSFHMFVWCLLFLGLVAVFDVEGRCRRSVAVAMGFGALLSAFRLVPAALTYWGKEQAFIGGYPTLADLVSAFVTIKTPLSGQVRGLTGNAGWWEYDFFLGVIGAGAMCYWGIFRRFVPPADRVSARFAALDWPLAIMGLLCLSSFYAVIAQLPLPLVSSERVTSRMLIVPFVFILVIACTRLEADVPRIVRRAAYKWSFLAAVVQCGVELATHSKLWRIEEWAPLYLGGALEFRHQIASVPDPIYVQGLAGSAIVSGAALVTLALLWLRAPKMTRGASPGRTSHAM